MSYNIAVMGVDAPIEMDGDGAVYFNMDRIRKIQNLESVASKVKLLHIVSCMVDEISGLDECLNLEELSLYQNEVSKIENLSHLVLLRVLDLSFNRIKKIENLEKLSNLQTLHLSSNKIALMEGLSSLRNLKLLELGCNKLREVNVAELEPLTQLEELWLGRNKIVEMAIPRLPHLRILSFQANRLEKYNSDIFQMCPKLEELHLGENNLEEPPAEILQLENLRLLDLAKNRVSTLDVIGKMISLEDLWLVENQIASLEEIKKLKDLKNLKVLYLEHNPIQLKLGPGYRNAICEILPHLEQVDAVRVGIT